MTEYDVIKSLAQGFPRSKDQRNGLFTCDAELVDMGGQTWGMTMDEFTPEEDLFLGDDPVLLGRNLAVGTLSDLYASGVTPRFYMHSLALPLDGANALGQGLAQGVRAVLEEADCFFCGGDLGTAQTWRYCGFAMGPVTHRAVTRILPVEPQALWVTGTLGDANALAMTGQAPPEFELRKAEAEFIAEKATGCMDTSGGLFDALWMLADLNKGLGFTIDLETVPYDPKALEIARAMGVPGEAALIGGAGEYELVFTLPASLREIPVSATRIGEVVPGTGSVRLLRQGGEFVMDAAPPCPRGSGSRDEYIRRVVAYAGRLHA